LLNGALNIIPPAPESTKHLVSIGGRPGSRIVAGTSGQFPRKVIGSEVAPAFWEIGAAIANHFEARVDHRSFDGKPAPACRVDFSRPMRRALYSLDGSLDG